MQMLGYASAFLMGSILGLLGGGGSILSVPIFVYLFGIPASIASGYSLFVVGFSAAIGAVQYAKKRLIDLPIGVAFSIPSLVGVYISRRWIVPTLPHIIFESNSIKITKDTLILLVFAGVMILAAFSMIKKAQQFPRALSHTNLKHYFQIGLKGLLVGGITGFVGAGGGFLIVPALVVLLGLEMKVAIGTSLMIIALKSLLGFIGDIQTNPSIHWMFLLKFSGISLGGIFVGISLSKRFSSQFLKPAFGWFVLIMGIWMITKEVFF